MNSKSLIESLLFVSAKALSVKDLADFLQEDKKKVEEILQELSAEYNNKERGIRIIENNKKYQMASSPENSKELRKFLQREISTELTPASLETLTIIAYRGPIKKSDLEKIRGINCSLILRNLLLRGLIEELTDKNEEEKLYALSFDFIKFLGVNTVKDLPDYDKFHNNKDIDRVLGRDILDEESSPELLYNEELVESSDEAQVESDKSESKNEEDDNDEERNEEKFEEEFKEEDTDDEDDAGEEDDDKDDEEEDDDEEDEDSDDEEDENEDSDDQK